MDIEPLKTILSVTDDKKDTLLHFLEKDVRKKVIDLELEENDIFMNDRVFCIKKNDLRLDIVGRVVSVDGTKIAVKKTPSCTVYINTENYYIFVRYSKKLSNQRDFLEQLMQTL